MKKDKREMRMTRHITANLDLYNYITTKKYTLVLYTYIMEYRSSHSGVLLTARLKASTLTRVGKTLKRRLSNSLAVWKKKDFL